MRKYKDRKTGKIIIEINDLSFLKEKDHPYGWFKRHFLHFRLKLALRRVDIIHVSDTVTGIDLVRYYFIPKDKIIVNANIKTPTTQQK
jgi:hypothetical protein